MATAPSPQDSSPNAAVVIRERIKQKRLFEAQFLFGLLDEDDISPQEKLVLERELNGLLAVVRDLQIQANKYLAEGEYNLARKMHKEMERIAVDVPGLEDGKRRIGAAREEAPVPVKEQPQTEQPPQPLPAPKSDLDDILSPLDDLPDIAPEPRETETSGGMKTTEAPAAAEAAPEPAKAKKTARSSKMNLWLAASILVVVLLGLLLIKIVGDKPTPPVTPQPQPGQKAEVAIEPLSVRQNDAAPKPAEGQSAGAEEAQSGSITIGELRVEE